MARILVVEDEPAVRAAVAGLLADAGYDVAAAPDAAAGLAATGDWQPAVVLLDPPVGPLPDAALVRRYRAGLPPGGVVLLFTAREQPAALAAAIGADGAVAKPYDADRLLALLGEPAGAAC